MASIRDQILDAVLTALNTGTPAGVSASTREHKIYEASQLPSITIKPVSETVLPIHSRTSLVKERQLRFVAEIRCIGAVSDKAADKHVVWVTKKLDGFSSGLVNWIAEEGDYQWLSEVQDQVYGQVTMPFTAYYQTKKSDQELKN